MGVNVTEWTLKLLAALFRPLQFPGSPGGPAQQSTQALYLQVVPSPAALRVPKGVTVSTLLSQAAVTRHLPSQPQGCVFIL